MVEKELYLPPKENKISILRVARCYSEAFSHQLIQSILQLPDFIRYMRAQPIYSKDEDGNFTIEERKINLGGCLPVLVKKDGSFTLIK